MKNVFMKRLAILLVAALAMSLSAVSQTQGDKAVGGNLVFVSSNGYSSTGIGAKLFYNVTDPIRLAGEFDYFLKKNASMWDLSAYGHYLFPVQGGLVVYPSVGLGILGSSSHSDLAVSLGGGLDFKLTSDLTLNGELRLKLVDGSNWFNFVVGVAYSF